MSPCPDKTVQAPQRLSSCQTQRKQHTLGESNVDGEGEGEAGFEFEAAGLPPLLLEDCKSCVGEATGDAVSCSC